MPDPILKPTQLAHLDAFRRRRGKRELRITLEEWPDALGRYHIGIRAYERDPASGEFEPNSRSGCLIFAPEIPRLIDALRRAEEIIEEGESK